MSYLRYACLGGWLLLLACESGPVSTTDEQQEVATFVASDLKPLIAERSKAWGVACRNNDISPLQDLYDPQAHYLPNEAAALHGKDAILAYWQESLPYLADLTLTTQSLEGTPELLYETGVGIIQVMNAEGQFDPMPFKYVNIWKLQPDGSYRVVVDTFNQPAS